MDILQTRKHYKTDAEPITRANVCVERIKVPAVSKKCSMKLMITLLTKLLHLPTTFLRVNLSRKSSVVSMNKQLSSEKKQPFRKAVSKMKNQISK